MRNVGFVASSVGHVLVLGWGLVSLPAPESHDVTQLEILPVDLVTIADVTDVRKGDAKAKVMDKVQEEIKKAPEPKKEEPKPAPKIEPEPQESKPKPKAEPVPKEEPKPEPTPEPAPKEPEPEKEEPKVEEPKPIVPKAISALPKIKPKPPKKKPPKKKPAKKKREFDADALKALANKADEAAPKTTGEREQKASFGSKRGKNAAAMTQSELDALRAQVARCWSPPIGATDASQLRVRLEFGLDREGYVTTGPEIMEFPASQFGVAAAESASRAVRRCQPYSLPADKYDSWRRVRINFDPSDMF